MNIDNGRDVSREMTRGASEARHPSHRCGGDDPRRMHAHTSRVSREKPLTHEPSTQRVPVGRRELSGERSTTDCSRMRHRDADRHGSRRDTYTAQSDTGRIFGVPMSTGSREYENGSTHGSVYQDPRPQRHNFPQDSSHHDTRHDSPSAGQHFPWYSNRNINVDQLQRNYDVPPRNPLQYTNIPTPENGTTTLGITTLHPPDDDRRDYNRPDAFTRSYCPTKVLSKKVHCRSLSSIHIPYNHNPVEALRSLAGRLTAFEMFNWPEVVKP